jgi:hypothetical protein
MHVTDPHVVVDTMQWMDPASLEQKARQYLVKLDSKATWEQVLRGHTAWRYEGKPALYWDFLYARASRPSIARCSS